MASGDCLVCATIRLVCATIDHTAVSVGAAHTVRSSRGASGGPLEWHADVTAPSSAAGAGEGREGPHPAGRLHRDANWRDGVVSTTFTETG